MFKTINGRETGIFYISSIKKDTAENTLIFYLMNGGSFKEQYGSADEMENTYNEFIDNGFFIQVEGRLFNTLHFSTIDKADVDGKYLLHIVVRTGETIICSYDTAAERDDFFDEVIDSTMAGGLIQADTFNNFPANGSKDKVYLAKDTGQTYYWDEAKGVYLKIGTAGKTGVFSYNSPLPTTIGSVVTLDKTDLVELVKPSVPYMEGSEIIANNSVHGVIIKINDTTVDVKTITDLVIDSFRQVDTLSELPQAGVANIMYYIRDIDEFRIWDGTGWAEPCVPNSNIVHDLTDQLNGVTQTFTFDESITSSKPIAVFYAGQYLVNGINYIIDFTNHTLTTLFPEAPTADEDRHLILLTADVTVPSRVQTVTGIIDGLVDNTDPMNPIIGHDNTKIDKSTLNVVNGFVEGSTSISQVDDKVSISTTSVDVNTNNSKQDNIILNSIDGNIKFEVVKNDTETNINISSIGNTQVYSNPFSFDGVLQEFNLPETINLTRPLLVLVNGIVLTEGEGNDYIIESNKIRFTCIFEPSSNSTLINFK